MSSKYIQLSAISDLSLYDIAQGKSSSEITSANDFSRLADGMYIEATLSSDESTELSSRKVSLKSIFDLIATYVENRIGNYVLLSNENRPIVTNTPLSVCCINGGIILSCSGTGNAVSVVNDANFNGYIDNAAYCVATSAVWN